MSSEKRWIAPNTLESDVPPLKTSESLNSGCPNSTLSSQHHPEILFHDGRVQTAPQCGLLEIQTALGKWEFEESQVHDTTPSFLASSRKTACIHAGAYRRSRSSSARSATGMVRRRWAIRSGVRCACPRCRRAWMSNPLNRPAVAMFRGVVRRKVIAIGPSFTVRLGPLVRNTIFAGTCSESPSKLAA